MTSNETDNNVLTLDDEEETQMIELVSKDGRCFTLPQHCLRVSPVLQNFLDATKDANEKSIPLSMVDGDVLQKVVKYLAYRNGEEAKLKTYEPDEGDDEPTEEQRKRVPIVIMVGDKRENGVVVESAMKSYCNDPRDAHFVDRVALRRASFFPRFRNAVHYLYIPHLEVLCHARWDAWRIKTMRTKAERKAYDNFMATDEPYVDSDLEGETRVNPRLQAVDEDDEEKDDN